MEKRTRAALAPLVVAVAIAAAVIVYFVLLGQSTNVDMPANDADPEEVVRVYLEALGAHDCNTALALTTPTKGRPGARASRGSRTPRFGSTSWRNPLGRDMRRRTRW